ncbi:heavy-metal-associated domain-containing protein [Malaciobacter mytili]|uniref:heavy-metal-associated domain-containing protein n=1 Tax=Malaciobacter mytili TaxID=603050 RepID=UPI003A88C88F
MKKTFKVNNIACANCANLIKASLEENFGEILVNLEKEPREVTLEIENEKKEVEFKAELKELGFEVIEK